MKYAPKVYLVIEGHGSGFFRSGMTLGQVLSSMGLSGNIFKQGQKLPLNTSIADLGLQNDDKLTLKSP